jgi:Apea-like HEPN
MEKIFYKAVVFCDNPLTGYYRFEDKFQIYPFVSENAPQSDKIKMYAVAIEYCVDRNVEMEVPELLKDLKDTIARTTHSTNYQRQILSLLSAVSNYRFYYPTPSIQWFGEIPNGELKDEMNKHKSKAGLSLYWYPEMFNENQITSFTEPKFPKVEFVKHPDCFMNLDIEGKEEVKFTQHIDVAIHNYFALIDNVREIVNSAISLICNGIDLRIRMKSISFISFVSSIETMVNYEFRDEEVKKCDTCGTQQFRVMGKFRDYLLKYASDNEKTKKEVNDIYNLRSKIAHTGLLFLGDNKIDWSNDAMQNEQWQTHIQVMQISRVSLTNWLLMRAKA